MVVKIIKGPKDSEEIGERILLTLEPNFKQSGIHITGDIGALSGEDCPSGRKLPVLDKLLGRTVDYIATPSGKQVLS